MSNSSKYPKFVWIAGVVILVVIVGYVLFSGQPVRKLVFPGGSATFGEKPRDEAISFFISYTRDKYLIEGDAVVYLAGVPNTKLHVDRSTPFSTVTVTVPKPGEYAYRIEQKEVMAVLSGTDLKTMVPMSSQKSGEGRIDVQSGMSFKLVSTLLLDGGSSRWTTSLEVILSEEERKKLEDEAIRQLEEWEEELGNR